MKIMGIRLIVLDIESKREMNESVGGIFFGVERRMKAWQVWSEI